MIQDIYTKIEQMIDPDLGVTLKGLNAVKKIEQNDDKISLELELPGPTIYLCKNYENIMKKIFDAEISNKINLNIVEKEIDKKNYRKYEKLNQIKNIIAVSSGKGEIGRAHV